MNASTVKVSNRETEILKLMSDGYTSKEIGKQLYISHLTVDKHKRNMLTKFNARNSVQLVVHADRLGLLTEIETYSDINIVQRINDFELQNSWSGLTRTSVPF